MTRFASFAIRALPALALLVPVPSASADFVTSLGGFPAPDTLVDFNQFTRRVNGMGPVQVGTAVGENIIFTSTSASSFVGITTGYLLGANGSWEPSKGPSVGSNTAAPVTLAFRFNSGPVSSVGAFMNYNADNPQSLIIAALASDGSVLESYDISSLAPIITPGATDAGAFRGITRATADIAAFTLSDKAVLLDDLRFSRVAAVPEPSGLVLLGSGAVGFIALAGRRRVGGRGKVLVPGHPSGTADA